jgi:hypothetical protein
MAKLFNYVSRQKKIMMLLNNEIALLIAIVNLSIAHLNQFIKQLKKYAFFFNYIIFYNK